MELTLRESQLATLEIMSEIDKICKLLNIKYFLLYGTLIGAVRHNGYIPWDDDFDIGMKREDYDKFLSYCYLNSEKILPFNLKNKRTDPGCWYNITRFCDTRYRCEYSGWKYFKESGLFVDIYPYDGMGKEDDKKYWKKILLKRRYYLKMLQLTYSDTKFPGSNLIHKILNFPLLFIARRKMPVHYLDKLERITTKFSWDESDYVYCCTWGDEFHLPAYPKAYFEEFSYLKFEDREFLVPTHYDEILRTMYGDYLKLPPEDQRKPGHSYKVYKNNE